MLKIFAGLKGSGKTKNLIEMVNTAAASAHGNVVCIEQGNKLIHEITNKARLIDTLTYGVDSADELYGFICGILASNYDITDLFIDSALKICRNDMEHFEAFMVKVIPLLKENNINFTVTASIETEKIPSALKGYLA